MKAKKRIPDAMELESDTWDKAIDSVLNEAEQQLLPFLQYHGGIKLAAILLERLETHLATELHYIRTGHDKREAEVEFGEFGSVNRARTEFLRMGGKKL